MGDDLRPTGGTAMLSLSTQLDREWQPDVTEPVAQDRRGADTSVQVKFEPDS